MPSNERKKPMYVWIPKHQTRPRYVCTDMTKIAEVSQSHIETVRKNMRQLGYYECYFGIAYQVELLKTRRRKKLPIEE